MIRRLLPDGLTSPQLIALFAYSALVPWPLRANYLQTVIAALAGGADPYPADAAVERACRNALMAVQPDDGRTRAEPDPRRGSRSTNRHRPAAG